jgi:hypothetical protein
MSLILVKETGLVVANANSYASAADGDAYHEGHLYAQILGFFRRCALLLGRAEGAKGHTALPRRLAQRQNHSQTQNGKFYGAH